MYRDEHSEAVLARRGLPAYAAHPLFGSVGLFIWDLRNDRGPGNIPYPSHARRAPGRAIAVGARLAF